MKKLLAILAILANPVFAQEQDTTPAATAAFITLPCDHSSKVFDILKANNERLVFAGDSLITSSQMGKMYEVGLYVWMNLDTQTSSVTILFYLLFKIFLYYKRYSLSCNRTPHINYNKQTCFRFF